MAKQHKVEFSTEAERDPEAISEWIIDQSGFARQAINYVKRIRIYLSGFKNFPHRGTQRDDLYSGIRLIGFDRRVTVVFTVSDSTVHIVRILYGGRDIAALFEDESGAIE